MHFLQQIIIYLQQQNRRAFYLAFLRVALCAWYLKELFCRWPAFELIYSNHSFVNEDSAYIFRFFRQHLYWLRDHHMLIIYVCILLLLLNLFGIGKNIVSFLLYIALVILDGINIKFGNTGDAMALILAFYLIFANSFSYFTLFKQRTLSPSRQKMYNLLSNLVAYAIMLNLCVAYLASGFSKLQDAYWQNGTAIHYFLNYERHSIFAMDNYVALPAFAVKLLNYGTILFELSFTFLVMFRKTRVAALLMGLLMHACIYIIMMIYGMTFIFIMQYGIFYRDDEVLSFLKKIKNKFIMNRSLPGLQL